MKNLFPVHDISIYACKCLHAHIVGHTEQSSEGEFKTSKVVDIELVYELLLGKWTDNRSLDRWYDTLAGLAKSSKY